MRDKVTGRMLKTHGLTASREYGSWRAMRKRCGTPSDPEYKNYGGRGIKVCERWNSFEAFLEDIGSRPSGHSLERVDVNGNYEPGNCRWATIQEQNRNRRDNTFLTFNGKTMIVTDWAREIGVEPWKLYARIKYGWPLEKVLNPRRFYKPRASHCKRGHEMTPQNSYYFWHNHIEERGCIACRAFKNERCRIRYAAKKQRTNLACAAST